MVFSITAPSEEVTVGYFLFIFSATSPFNYLPQHLPALADDDEIMQAVYVPALGLGSAVPEREVDAGSPLPLRQGVESDEQGLKRSLRGRPRQDIVMRSPPHDL